MDEWMFRKKSRRKEVLKEVLKSGRKDGWMDGCSEVSLQGRKSKKKSLGL